MKEFFSSPKSLIILIASLFVATLFCLNSSPEAQDENNPDIKRLKAQGPLSLPSSTPASSLHPHSSVSEGFISLYESYKHEQEKCEDEVEALEQAFSRPESLDGSSPELDRALSLLDQAIILPRAHGKITTLYRSPEIQNWLEEERNDERYDFDCHFSEKLDLIHRLRYLYLSSRVERETKKQILTSVKLVLQKELQGHNQPEKISLLLDSLSLFKPEKNILVSAQINKLKNIPPSEGFWPQSIKIYSEILDFIRTY